MNKGIAIVGSLEVCHSTLSDTPIDNESVELEIDESLILSIDGTAGNVASDIAKIDPEINIKVFGKIGNDNEGEFIIKTLSQLGVDTDGIVTESTDSKSANASFSFDDIDFSKLSVDVFYIGYTSSFDTFFTADESLETPLANCLLKVSQLGVKTSLGLFKGYFAQIDSALKYCDCLSVGEKEAAKLTGISLRDESGEIIHSSMKSAVTALFEMGVRKTVALYTSEGAWFSEKGSVIYHLPSLNLQSEMIKNTSGREDAFSAGVLYSGYSEFDPEYTLRVSLASSAVSLTEENSTDGLRTFDKIMEFESEIGYPAE